MGAEWGDGGVSIRVSRNVSYDFWAGVERKDEFSGASEKRIAYGNANPGTNHFTLILNDHQFHMNWTEWDEITKAIATMRDQMREAQP